ncbi:hypothetical protein V6N13_012423 [Hibiscus sabdariffa]|uniref:ACT domain-containing protein n=1 Tax=Hibiscus sabdariffa TaxID=183260 RepID=A0ABR2SG11_9ROSI
MFAKISFYPVGGSDNDDGDEQITKTLTIDLQRVVRTEEELEYQRMAHVTCLLNCDNSQSSMAANIEVTKAETHADLKILMKKQPRRLSKLVGGLQRLKLTVVNLNVTTADEMALYSINVKIEEGCHMNTADEIAESVEQVLLRIQQEAGFSCRQP